MAPITMAEVWLVVKHGLWILGLSVLLATWSYARYTAHQAGVRTRDKLGEPKYGLSVDIGLLLFIAGMVATEGRWWARLLWVIVGSSWIVRSVLDRREQSTAGDAEAEPITDEGGDR